MSTLLQAYDSNGMTMNNRVVMAPMTRTRAKYPGDLPTEINALYYAQRAGAGLIVSEAVNVSPQATGYLWVPGIYSEEQIKGWSKVTDAVHDHGGKIFMQLFHTGRLSHPFFQPGGELPVSASAVAANGYNAYITNYYGESIQVPFITPRALEATEIPGIINQFVQAAKNAITAGFDGVEIHAANGFLLEQFINPHVNNRTDMYGGLIENRSRLTLQITAAIAAEIGSLKTGVRLSPFGTLNGIGLYEEAEGTNIYIAEQLNKLNIAYLHLFNQAAFGTGELPDEFIRRMRTVFENTLILCGGYTYESANKIIESGLADLIAFGRPYISNPDLVERFRSGAPLAASNQALWYGSNGEEGYVDYPFIS